MLKSQRIQGEYRMSVFIKKWSSSNAEMGHIFGGFVCVFLTLSLQGPLLFLNRLLWHGHVCFLYPVMYRCLLRSCIVSSRICMAAEQCTERTVEQGHWCKQETSLVQFGVGSTECSWAMQSGLTWTVTSSCVIIECAGEHTRIGINSVSYIGETTYCHFAPCLAHTYSNFKEVWTGWSHLYNAAYFWEERWCSNGALPKDAINLKVNEIKIKDLNHGAYFRHTSVVCVMIQ